MRASWSKEAGAPSLPLAGALATGVLAAAVFAVPPSAALGAALAIASERTLHGPSNPAAEMAALGARARNGGIFLAVMVVVIVSLMAGKPAI